MYKQSRIIWKWMRFVFPSPRARELHRPKIPFLLDKNIRSKNCNICWKYILPEMQLQRPQGG